MIGKLFGIGNNEKPLVRGIRLIIFAGIAAALTEAVKVLPTIDWPGTLDVYIISIGTGLLGAADKWLRSRS